MSPDGGLHHQTLQRVPETNAIKSRVYLDLFVDDLDTEVVRLVDLGATVVAEHDDDGGYRTAMLGDPEHNEFCVVRRR